MLILRPERGIVCPRGGQDEAIGHGEFQLIGEDGGAESEGGCQVNQAPFVQVGDASFGSAQAVLLQDTLEHFVNAYRGNQ